MSRHLQFQRLQSGFKFAPRAKKRAPVLDPREEAFQVSKLPKTVDENNPVHLGDYGGSSRPRIAQFVNQPPEITTSTGEYHKSPQPAPGEADSSSSRSNLPLSNVSVHMVVHGIIAHTTLIQTFHNSTDEAIDSAQYTFPLYDGAVLTSFNCTVGDVCVIEGQVKPKEEARKEFRAAVEKKEVAALLEEQTPEVFQTTIGNIPAKIVITVRITYINELKVVMDENLKEALSVIIPMSIAPRYGFYFKPHQEPGLKESGLEIEVKIDNPDGRISNMLTESDHDIEFDLDVVTDIPKVATSFDELEELSANPVKLKQSVAKHSSKKPRLKDDFILIIQMHDNWPLHSRAVLSPANAFGHAAMMVNIKPSELFSNAVQAENFTGEIIFLIDRSASMSGLKIGTIRQALPLSLVSLPTGCAFNVVSFGSKTKPLWSTSKVYSGSALTEAVDHTSRLEADMGGTELVCAIEEVIDSRLQDRKSLQIIILTDGEVESEEIAFLVWRVRQELGDLVRFFALGIGTEVSHHLIECVGEFGGGYGEVVDISKTPKWTKRLTRMLKGSMMPNSWTCEIDLGQAFQRRSLLDFDLSHKSQEANSKIQYIQAPHPAPPFHPFTYRSIFFLLEMSKQHSLQEISELRNLKLTTTTKGAKLKVANLEVETAETDMMETIHHLAAKAVLLNLETEVAKSASDQPQLALAKRNGEHIGTAYGITSKWTSFVAVNRSTQVSDDLDFYQTLFKPINLSDQNNLLDQDNLSDQNEEYLSGSGSGSGSDLDTDHSFESSHMMHVDYVEPSGEAAAEASYDFDDSDVERAEASFESDDSDVAEASFKSNVSDDAHGEPPGKRHSEMVDDPRESSSDVPAPPGFHEEERGFQHKKKDNKEKQTPIPEEEMRKKLHKFGFQDNQIEAIIDPKPGNDGQDSTRKTYMHAGSGNQAESQVMQFGDNQNSNSLAPAPGGIAYIQFGDYFDEERKNQREAAAAVSADYQNDEDISWEEAATGHWQDSTGIFKLHYTVFRRLYVHFCGSVAEVIQDYISTRFPGTRLHIGDIEGTLMLVQYFKTHLAEDQDIWEMMIEKAEYAVRQLLGVEDDEDALKELQSILEHSIMHAHFRAKSDSSAKDSKPFPPVDGINTCPVCGAVIEVPPRESFSCPFEGCPVSTSDWNHMWSHQVKKGHIVCG